MATKEITFKYGDKFGRYNITEAVHRQLIEQLEENMLSFRMERIAKKVLLMKDCKTLTEYWSRSKKEREKDTK